MTREQALENELQRAYRCIQGMHHAMLTGKQFDLNYHAMTVGAAKRYVFEGAMDGSTYFLGRPTTVLHEALLLPKGVA